MSGSATIEAKYLMLEAYKMARILDEYSAQLPKNAARVMQKLNDSRRHGSLNARAVYMLAQCQLICDDLEEARNTLESLIELDPDNAAAKTELAKIYSNNRDFHKATKLLAEVTNSRPEIAENWSLLGEFLRQDGQIDASRSALDQYGMIKAFNHKLHTAEQAFAGGDFVSTDKICRHLLQLVPNEVRTLRLLSRVARQFDHYDFSTSTLCRCVEARPGDAALRLEYAYSLLGSRMYQESLVQCQRLAELAPHKFEVFDLEAEVFFKLGRYEEAIAIYRELSEIPEKRASSLLHLGKVLKTVGEAAEATSCYQQAVEIEPVSGQAYWELADLKTYRFSIDEIASMHDLLKAKDISALNKVMIGFALGKALEDEKRFEESFEHYRLANSEYAKLRPFRHVSGNDRARAVFTAEYFTARRGFGNDTDAAIFVVGLPRSGTTMLEQILSSHSQVDATQELDEIVSIARAVNDSNQSEQRQYPYSLRHLNTDQVAALAQRYLDYAKPRRRQAPYFVDKAPHNFHHVGLIKTLFPNAKIIDVRRNPMASGWSLYRQFFADSYLFSYDLESIGKYFNCYVELMDHWHSVLPNEILTVSYEDLVGDLSATIAIILDYCGLPFEQACIDFHLNKRAVATPSSEQVRQPLYSHALGHWQNFEKFLDPLKRTIEHWGLAEGK